MRLRTARRAAAEGLKRMPVDSKIKRRFFVVPFISVTTLLGILLTACAYSNRTFSFSGPCFRDDVETWFEVRDGAIWLFVILSRDVEVNNAFRYVAWRATDPRPIEFLGFTFGTGRVVITDSARRVGCVFYRAGAPVWPFFLPLATWALWRTYCVALRRRRKKEGLCFNCTYNLTGNVSGICPECGTAI